METSIQYIAEENGELVAQGNLWLTHDMKIPHSIRCKGRSFVYTFSRMSQINDEIGLVYSITYNPDDIVWV